MSLRRYLLWRTAATRYGRRPWQLSAEERSEAERQSAREYLVITRALAAPEAEVIRVDPEVVAAAMAAFSGQATDRTTFLAELGRAGLDETGLLQAIADELRAGLLLERIGAEAKVEESEVRAWYECRRGRLVAPERRAARHILITFSADLPENAPGRARARMARVEEELAAGIDFETLALRYSECPSALEGGRLGEVRRGQLFGELDAALFALEPGCACVAESPLGVHLLRCDAVIPPQTISYEVAAPSIRTRLESVARDRAMKAWLAAREKEEGSNAGGAAP